MSFTTRKVITTTTTTTTTVTGADETKVKVKVSDKETHSKVIKEYILVILSDHRRKRTLTYLVRAHLISDVVRRIIRMPKGSCTTAEKYDWEQLHQQLCNASVPKTGVGKPRLIVEIINGRCDLL